MIIGRSIEELDARRDPRDASPSRQAKGVDYFTIHAGVAREHLPFIRKRLIGVVSRGGSLLAKWMLHHGQENPMYTHCRGRHLRRDARIRRLVLDRATACARAGWPMPPTRHSSASSRRLGELTERAWREGCPGDGRGAGARAVRPGRVQHEAPAATLPRRAVLRARPARHRRLPRLRPHHERASARRPRAYHGAAMLCYVTPKEHLGPAEEGRRQAGVHRLQDRRPCIGRGSWDSRHP